MKRTVYLMFAAIIFTALAVDAHATDRFGLIFDINGKVSHIGSNGNKVLLERSSHILMPITVGDKFEVAGQGMVLIVSLRDKKGYEVTSDTKAVVQSDGLAAIQGTVLKRDGLKVPMPGASSNPIGAVVLRAAARKSCIKIISPLNTAVLSLKPMLKWEKSCEGLQSVNVRILHERKVIYVTQAQGESLRIPEGVLKSDSHYRWLVDAAPVSGISGGAFTTISEDVYKEYENVKSDEINNDLPQRLSFIFFLIENNLRSEALPQLNALKSDYPENEFLKNFVLENRHQ